MKSTRTHYERLNIARDAPPEVVKAAYKALTQKYHPDKNPGNDEAARTTAVLNRAYEVLIDPVARRQHDDWIDAQEAGEALQADSLPERRRPGRRAVLRTAGIGAGALLVAVAGLSGAWGLWRDVARAREERRLFEAQWAAAAESAQALGAPGSAVLVPPMLVPAPGFSFTLEDSGQSVPQKAAGPQRPPPRRDRTLTLSYAVPGAGVADSPGARPGRTADNRTSSPGGAPEDKASAERSSACEGTAEAFPDESYTGYLPGRSMKNAGGHSSLAIDNMGGNRDVLVRLIDVEQSLTARSFQVRANSSFELMDLRAGKYRIVYRPRSSKCRWYAAGDVDVEPQPSSGMSSSGRRVRLYEVEELDPGQE